MDFGWLSILPPVIAIVLALLTKEVISSLLLGILSGVLIYAGGNIIGAVDALFSIMGEKIGGNALIILFLALLGALVVVITKAGGSYAYGNWAAQKIKSRRGALLSTSALGALIFVDDYFNCLTVGTVMKPVTDKHKISREKLAYIIDSTAAPVCIIAPISSWAVSVGSTIQDAGIEDGFGTFISTIPFNYYAILTILMLVVLGVTRLDFGSMRRYEAQAQAGHIETAASDAGNLGDIEISKKGRVFDLVIPIVSLIVITLLAMLYTGGLFTGGTSSILEAFGNTDANTSLVWGGFAALIVAFFLFVPRKVLSFRSFMDGITEGVKSMVPAFIILTLAWTISGVCSDTHLNTGHFVGELVRASNLPMELLPAIVFLVAGGLAFATGTSWGTFGILVPIVLGITASMGQVNATLQSILISAVLAGAVYGDHISPISDTTILSSTGAGCNHLNHVSSQIPYASLVAGCCFVSYIAAGYIQNVYVSMLIAVAILALALLATFYASRKKNNATA